MGERRLELVEECEHGYDQEHQWAPHGPSCALGSRTVLSVPSEEMVEAAARAEYEARAQASDYEWQEWTDLDDAEAGMWMDYMLAALAAALGITIEEET